MAQLPYDAQLTLIVERTTWFGDNALLCCSGCAVSHSPGQGLEISQGNPNRGRLVVNLVKNGWPDLLQAAR
ncbi:hypothetical protein HNQ08_005190 [Deinococcus humi]|uniref:Uncharacterized protein n=1 Tax=Deinococcus humi TaxID=662880 RepID=A0A7W8JZK3_9DEIO|nr:hypothetical protein [Deinococcus humi]GGO39994.1 hypothetical protein GCM10008949_48930 [Deinococcus humi]